jgi:hypothetical protein
MNVLGLGKKKGFLEMYPKKKKVKIGVSRDLENSWEPKKKEIIQ